MKRYIKSVAAVYASSMSRILSHVNDRNIATITAFITSDDPDRPTKKNAQSHKKNRKDNSDLSKAIRSSGYGFSKITGYWDESKSGDPGKAVREETYLVICTPTTPYDAFEQSIIDLAKAYEQQAVLVWNCEEQIATLWGTNDYNTYVIWNTYHDFNVDSVLSEAWSRYHSHTFTFDNQTEFYIESATELTVGAEGPTSCRAAKYYRDRLHKELNRQ